jgi:hypothetical protein
MQDFFTKLTMIDHSTITKMFGFNMAENFRTTWSLEHAHHAEEKPRISTPFNLGLNIHFS